MKKLYSLLLLLSLISIGGFGQTMFRQFHIEAACCDDSAKLDIENDGSLDVMISSWFGFDSGAFDAWSLRDSIQITGPQPIGESFTSFSNHGLVAQTTMGCNWSNLWHPGNEIRTMGFYKLLASGDTTFGWIELRFRGSAINCQDTVYALFAAWSTVPNVHLNSGEFTTGIESSTVDFDYRFFPNPASDLLIFEAHSQPTKVNLVISNLSGQKVKSLVVNSSRFEIDIRDLAPGVYFVQSDNGWRRKFVVPR